MIYFLFNFLKDNYSCILPRNRCFWNLGTYLKKEFIHTASACYAYKKPTDKKASIMNTQLLRIFRHSSQCVEDTFLKFCLLLCFCRWSSFFRSTWSTFLICGWQNLVVNLSQQISRMAVVVFQCWTCSSNSYSSYIHMYIYIYI